MKDVVHQYYKLANDEATIIVQINPETFAGVELIILPDGQIQKTPRQLDKEVYEDLKEDGFEPSSPLEFNLYLMKV